MSSKNKSGNTTAEPVKVYKWDGVAVKNALDDVITEVNNKSLKFSCLGSKLAKLLQKKKKNWDENFVSF